MSIFAQHCFNRVFIVILPKLLMLIMIKAVFFDIDGTLVSFNTHQIPESTMFALNALRQKGIKIFIATGRSLNQMKRQEQLPAFDGYILLNGNYCMTDKGEVIFRNNIPPKDLEQLSEFHKTHPFPVEFVYEDYETMTEKNESVEQLWANVNIPVPPVVSMQDSSRNGVFQLGIFLSPEEETKANIIERFMPNCESMRWCDGFFDVIPKGSKKSGGMDKFISHFGIKLEETMAFGDGGNDIDMIKHAGIGVAMGNARDEVKAAADYVTTSVDDNGILNALIELNILEPQPK